MKKLKNLFIGISAIFLAIFAGSCDIGLGAAVDVAAPTISITYPEQASVIRDSFILAGDCDDDMGVAKVSITISRTDTGKTEFIKTFEVTADNEAKRWQAEINQWLGEGKGYNGWELCDGKYVADVIASDEAGRVSGIASLSFDIDNTAPIFILKNPTSENALSPTSFGTIFKVAGTLADDHTVSTMTISVYDIDADFDNLENPPVPLLEVVENNVDVTTEILVASFNKEGDLKERFKAMYAGAEDGDNKNLICKINVEDNAKIYKNPLETENKSLGNNTNDFYITDKVSKVWTSGDMDPGRVKKVVNGTATNVTQELKTQILDLYNNAHSDKTYFYINSDANPTYEFSSYGFARNAEIKKLATTSATITYNLTYGRNQENIDPATVKVFLWGPFENGEVTEASLDKMYTRHYEDLYKYYLEQKALGKARVIAYNGEGEWEGVVFEKDGKEDDRGYTAGSKDNYVESIELRATINPNKYYYLSAYAEDISGSPANPKGKNFIYAFKGQSTGAAPKVIWEDYEINGVEYKNTIEDQGIAGKQQVNFYGYAEFPDGTDYIEKLAYKAERTDISNATPIIDDVEKISVDAAAGRVYWKVTLPTVGDEQVQNWKVTVTAASTTAAGVNGDAKRSLTIDTKKPVINLKSLNPTVTKEGDTANKYVNGTIKIEGSIDEKNPSSYSFEIYSKDTDWKKVYPKENTPETEYKFDENERNISITIDTTDAKYGLVDKKPFKVVFNAEDKAGNKNSNETKYLNSETDYIVDQSTDIPVIEPTFTYVDNNATEIEQTAWYKPTDKLNFNLSDDDGLASVTVKIDDGEEKTIESINANATNTSFNYALTGLADGSHTIKVVATDSTYKNTEAADSKINKNRKTVWGPYKIGVDSAAPIVTDDYSQGTNYYKEKVAGVIKDTLKGTITEENLLELEVEVLREVGGNSSILAVLKWSEDKVAIEENGKWSVKPEEAILPEGIYTVTTIATDKAGKESSVSSHWIVDKLAPTITASITTLATKTETETVDSVEKNKNWYKTNTIAVEAIVSDTHDDVEGSGIKDVQYSLDGNIWTSLTQSADDTTKYTKNVTCEQGENKIYFRVEDKVGHETKITDDSNTVWVDTEAPVVSLVSLNGNTEESALFNGKKADGTAAENVVLIVKVEDSQIGVDKADIKVIKVGDNTVDISSKVNDDGTYTIEIPLDNCKKAGVLVGGDIYISYSDKLGNSVASKKIATLNVDNTLPIVTINSVSPIVKRASDNENCLNGKVKVAGKIDELNLDSSWYQVFVSGTESGAPVYLTKSEDTNKAQIIEFEYDTTAVGNGETLDIEIYAKDKAGNISTAAAISSRNGDVAFTVDQTTDKPVITPTNFDNANLKWYAGEAPITGKVTDDDKVASVAINVTKENGTPVSSKADAGENFSYALPATDGKYKVTITAKDSTYNETSAVNNKTNRQTVYGPFVVGVDTKAPEVTTNQTGTNYGKDNIELSGTAKDANGIKDITIEASLSGSVKATYTYGVAGKTDKVTYTPADGKWTCTISGADFTSLADGLYTFKITATDNAGKTNYASCNYTKDTVNPVISSKIIDDVNDTTTKNAKKTVGSETWYSSTSIAIKAVVSDTTSGVSNVQYSLDGTNWFSLVNTQNTNDWTGTVKCAQGTNTIQFKAVDKAGNEIYKDSSGNVLHTLTAKVDTVAPETITLAKVDGETLSGTKLINGSNNVKFEVSASDTYTGIKEVSLVKIGDKDVDDDKQSPVKAPNDNDNYEVTIDKSCFTGLGSGTKNITVKVTDKAGNSTEKTLFSINLDSTKPTVRINSVTPTISAGSTTKVNGTIKITGAAADPNLDKVWYTVSTKSGDSWVTEKEADGTTEKKHKLENGSVDITLDTTNAAYNSKTIKVTVHAQDKALNSDSAETMELVVDQSTDIPTVTTNLFKRAVPAGTWDGSTIPASEWFTGATDNTIIGTVSDDDILKNVVIEIKDKAGNTISGVDDTNLITSGSTYSTINFTHSLPKANNAPREGIYQVTIKATDNTYNVDDITANPQFKYGPYIVGVDTAAPTITQTAAKEKTYTDSSSTHYVNGLFTLKGTANDNNGIRSIVVTIKNNDASKTTQTQTKTYTYTKGGASNTVTYDEGTKDWSCEVKNADLTIGKYTITAVVTDYAGKTASAEAKYVKDESNPTVSVDTDAIEPAAKTITGKSDKWYDTPNLTITATASDDACEVTEVSYKLNSETNWTPFRKDTSSGNWLADIYCTKQGANTVYVRAIDEANKTDVITNTVYVDSQAPEKCEVISIDGKTDAETIAAKKLVNGKASVTFVVEAEDLTTAADCTGIASVSLTRIGNASTTPFATPIEVTTPVSGAKYSITIPADTDSKKYLASGTVYVTVTDKIGKSKEFPLFKIEKDSTPPEVTVNGIQDAEADTTETDVNGTISFTGSASDGVELKDVMLFYKSSASTVSAPTKDQGVEKTWTDKGWTKLTRAGSIYSWSATLDTTKVTDKQNLYFYAVAVDTAGNVKVSDVTKLYVNQDSDRPKLNINNLELTKKSGETWDSTKDTDNKFWHTEITLQGTVSDDDGAVSAIYWKNGSAGDWSSNIYSNGSWKIEKLQQGPVDIYFKVIDAAQAKANNTTGFVSAGSTGPKIYDLNDQLSTTNILPLKVDTQPASIDSVLAYTSNNATYDSDKAINNITALGTATNPLGGNNKYLFVKVTASDANGLNSVAVRFAGTPAASGNNDAKLVSQSTDKTETVVRYDISKITLNTEETKATKEFVVTATDKTSGNNNTSTSKYELIVDNKAPVVSFNARYETSNTFYASVSNSIIGTTSDGSRVDKLYFKVTDSSTAPEVDSSWNKVAYSVETENEIGIENWRITFDGNQTTKTEYHTSTLYDIYKTLANKSDAEMEAINDNLDMYLWMYAEDSVGNASIPVKLDLDVIPNADKPSVEITYPTEIQKDDGTWEMKPVGGTIRVTGITNILQNSVANVYVQIDPDYNGTTFATNWDAKLKALTNSSYTNASFETVTAAGNIKAIPATGTTGWGLTINANKEFNTQVSGENRRIAIRAFAVSASGRVSEFEQKIVEIDPNAPVFGQIAINGRTQMYVVQRAGDSPTGAINAYQRYQDGMSLKGKWFLYGSVSDDSGISKVYIKHPSSVQTIDLLDTPEGGSATKTTVNNYKDWINDFTDTNKDKNYIINIPIGSSEENKFGIEDYEVFIQDRADPPADSSYKFSITYDNLKPDFEITTPNTTAGGIEIKNSNGTYTISGKLHEDGDENTGAEQAGFERIVMFITKTKTEAGVNKTYIVDSMRAQGTKGTDNREDVTSLTKEDGLYWRTATTTAAGVSGGSMSITTLDTSKVRSGGLCKVDGIIYRIKQASGTTVQLDDTSVTATGAKTVKFAIGAFVIDNPIGEGGTKTTLYVATKTNASGADTVQQNGDGDQVMEKAVTTGTTTDWSVSIDSKQILDGNIKVNFVAFDKAGNIAKDDFDATVKNNAPRLAGVKFGSDLNNNGQIDDSEMNTTWANKYVNTRLNGTSEYVNGMLANGTAVKVITVEEKDRQTIKSNLRVIPQVVGGNIGLQWTMTYKDSADADVTTAKANLGTSGHSVDVVRPDYEINLDTLYFLQLNSNKGIARDTAGNKNKQTLTFTISDKHEDGSNAADDVKINIPVKVMFKDSDSASVSIKPFKWNSSTDNSLYNNSKAYGHIELGGTEWTDTTLSLGTDPKVSGIVTFEGTAKDNILVNKIEVSVKNGTWITIAERNENGTWTSGINNANLLVLREADATNNVTALTYEDYFKTGGNNKDWYFELVEDYTDLNEKLEDGTTANPDFEKNIVNFKFHWNTRTLHSTNQPTKKDVKFRIRATDKGSVELNGAKNGLVYTANAASTPGTTSTTDSANTGYYQMDVVPYVAHVYTELAALKKANIENWSVSGRTARGHYPVRVSKYNQSGTTITNGGETIYFYGFNLDGATYTDSRTDSPEETPLGPDPGTPAGVSVSGVYDVRTLAAHKIIGSEDGNTLSGKVALTVNGIQTINNVNNNNAKGSFTETLSASNYAQGAYNRVPNGINNNNLTDDLEFDVWDVNEGAAISDGRIEQPSMMVDPVIGKLGFAFVDGTFDFSMAGATGKAVAPTADTENNYSWSRWIRSEDFCTSAAFVYDSKGRAWGVTAGNENSNGTYGHYSDFLNILSSQWGKASNTYNANGANRRIERTNQDTWGNNDKQRIRNPALATTVHNNNATVYLAYYDAINDEIRIKYGSYGSTQNDKTPSNQGDFVDMGAYNSSTNYFTYAQCRPLVSVLAGDANTGDAYLSGTNKKAGEYFDIAVISAEGDIAEGDTADDKLVAVWYDGTTLWYSMNATPYGVMTNGVRGSWSTPVRVFAENSSMFKAGEYCKVAVDKKNGVHIAAYDPKNLDLCYAYLPANINGAATAQTDFATCVVDAQGVTGSNLNIEVGMVGTGDDAKIIPHISYYSDSLNRAKEAYYYGGFTNNSTSVPAGADNVNIFTENWEVSAVPTRQTLELMSNQYNAMCIGLWKTTGGEITTSTIGTNSSSESNHNGMIYGNGTSNPAVGYVTQVSSTKSCIEVAQKH